MREMGFMEKLLDGVRVEWLRLGEIGELVRGNGLPKTDFTENGVPAIHYGQIYTYYGNETVQTLSFVSSETAKKLKKVNKGDVVITNTSENLEDVGKALLYLGEAQAVTGGHATIFKPDPKILGKYFVYCTQHSFFFDAKRKLAKGTKVIDVSATDMAKIKFPIPCPDNSKKSLEIQAEIVRILDAMTAHTAELTAELTARKKQYDYYRDKLLSFEEDVYEFPLTDICTSIADGDHQAPPQTSTGINFVTISNISKNGFIDFSKTKYVPDDYYKNLASKRKPRFGDVLYTVVGSIGIPVFIDFEKEFTFQRHVAILRFKTELVNPKYVFHFMRSRIFFNKANSVAMGAAQKTITLGTLGKLKISLPSLERQNNIVAILDKFDSLANSITDGLPREIELRQKQYAYYRDLLLSFPAAQAA